MKIKIITIVLFVLSVVSFSLMAVNIGKTDIKVNYKYNENVRSWQEYKGAYNYETQIFEGKITNSAGLDFEGTYDRSTNAFSGSYGGSILFGISLVGDIEDMIGYAIKKQNNTILGLGIAGGAFLFGGIIVILVTKNNQKKYAAYSEKSNKALERLSGLNSNEPKNND